MKNTNKFILANITLITDFKANIYNPHYLIPLSCVQWIQILQHHVLFHQVSKRMRQD